MIVKLTGDDLSFEQLYEVSLNGTEASLAAEARARMIASRAVIEKIVAAETTAYGVNTGFGDLAEVRISSDQIRTLQINLVRSHACGVGASLTEPETRAIILLRANALAKGLSGVRPVLVETLFAMLNRRVHPVIPSQGSVGASGSKPRSEAASRPRSACIVKSISDNSRRWGTRGFLAAIDW